MGSSSQRSQFIAVDYSVVRVFCDSIKTYRFGEVKHHLWNEHVLSFAVGAFLHCLSRRALRLVARTERCVARAADVCVVTGRAAIDTLEHSISAKIVASFR